MARAAHHPSGPQSAGRVIRQTSPAVIGPASSRKTSCQAGGLVSAGLNQVWSAKINPETLMKKPTAAASMISRAHSGSSVVTQAGMAISTNDSGISM